MGVVMSFRRLIAVGSGSVAVVAFLGMGIETFEMLPQDSKVIVNRQSETYISIRCAKENSFSHGFREDAEFLGVLELRIVRSVGYKPDPVCRESGGFIEKRSSLTVDIIKSLFGG